MDFSKLLMISKENNAFNRWLEKSIHRFPDGYVGARTLKEQRKEISLANQESKLKHRLLSHRSLVPKLLAVSGLSSIARRQACDIRLNYNDLKIVNLPSSFNGYKLLHISDPHFNANEQLTDNLIDKINQATYDICVLTGDYRYRSFGPLDAVLTGLERLNSAIDSNIVAILGNHDPLSVVPEMEALGMNVLLNENMLISKNNESIVLAGVDDPSYYKTHDLSKTLILNNAPSTDEAVCTLLLAHSPNIIEQASKHGVNAYLCGHTHGGQICLPGGIPILKDSAIPRWCIAGKWHYENMVGYTSVGCGVSVAEARFFCPPEITVHTLFT